MTVLLVRVTAAGLLAACIASCTHGNASRSEANTMRLLPSAGPTTPESVTPCDAVAVLRTDLDARAFQDRAQLEADLEVITKLADGRFRADAERVTVALPNLDWEGDPLIQTLEGHCGGLVG